ncbi:hypothetical protein [Chlorogloeopsis sp. ULAP02]|uniref:hypothetical protein n=1 Tax=Chlorogloeopsis sp. ULAP02 TaxID=3107926 RepID=UPI003135E782
MRNDKNDWKFWVFFTLFMIVIHNVMRNCSKPSNVQRVSNDQAQYTLAKALIFIRKPEFNNGCKCPYDVAIDYDRCGDRSSWSRSGGEEPVCFFGDIYGYSRQ